MYCFHCGVTLDNHDFCPGCGTDVSTYKKIIYISNTYYNQGLEKASVRDMTGAVESLRQCLKFNKNNVEARNLLGLVYYETGEVVAALSEWVISKNLRPKKNIADDYIAMVQNNPGKLETINQTIRKYNMALNYCLQDSHDLAIIQLKKVLSLNPKFVRAHQLLALLYIEQEEWEKAEKEVERCEKIDIGNTTTRRYRKEVEMMLHPMEVGEKKKTGKKDTAEEEPLRYHNGHDLVIQPKHKKDPGQRHIASVLYLLIGLAVGVAVAWGLIMPARIQLAKADVSKQLKTVSEELAAETATSGDLRLQVDTLERENASMKEELAEYVSADGSLSATDDLLTAAHTYMTEPENLETISACLQAVQDNLDVENSSEAFRNVYNLLIGAVGQSIATGYYNDGLDAYRKEMYPDAVAFFERAYRFDGENIDILYNLANAYYRSGDTDRAEMMYRKVMELFPDTERAKRSSEYLAEITG